MLHERICPTLSVFKNKIYAIGGQDSLGNYLNTVEMYDPVVNIWVEVSPLNISRFKAG